MSNQKEIVPPLLHEGKPIEYTNDLFRNIIWVFNQLRYNDKQKYTIGKIPEQTFKVIKKEDANFTDRGKKFCFNCFNHIITQHHKQFYFNFAEKCFKEIGKRNDTQFHNGTYYGYFKTEKMIQIQHFILLINGENVDMWSKPKNATGKIIHDRHTFSMVLVSTKFDKNYEFYMGNNSDNPNLKYFIALWRNSLNEVKSVICMIKFIGKKFKKIEDIMAVKATIREDMEAKMPIFAKDFFKQHEKQSVSYDITGYEYE